jgi:hypothetical protein
MNQPKSIVDNKFTHAKQVAGGGEPPDNELSTEHRMTALETRLDTILPTLATKADIHQAVGETHKWMIATVIGLFLGFGGLFLAMSNALKPNPMMMQPQPIIIQVPVAPQK